MRKHVKQEILQLIESLYQAHREIEDIVKKGQLDSGRSMLGECQEYAINLGNIIEQIESEDCITVSYLEKYCEVLFRVHESLHTDSNVSKIMKKLDNALANIENSVKHDIPVRKEVVFFPYKASMWDSLESVYLAAKEDPDCDAYCVPIPYFDRNSDGSLGQMHYEGSEYPKNIEVIDWKKYNLADRKPDTIYIHNPYDDWNRVTCVHPDYFSNKLKQYTDELVYIPYFVLQEIDPSNQTVIDNIKHFCFQPAIINADKVILQSENMKQIYVAEYRKAAMAQGLTGAHIDKEALDKKFLGIGSPKFDKVLRTKKEDLEIPQEWLKIIEKPDGTWKKIIFYNTSIGALLEHNEKMLEKMESVFETFKERQDEVALLWRPHPLIPSTVKSMRPQLWVKYQQMVERYKAEGWGIYDDTADMDRAVVLSDAYYGDGSSVVPVCQKAGIPVMLQNVEKRDACDFANVKVVSGARIGEEIWMAADNLNGIVKVTESGALEYICTFPGYPIWAQHLYRKAIQYKDKIIFLPKEAEKVAVYDLKEKEVKYIAIKNSNKDKSVRYVDIHIWQNTAYLFPMCEDDIIQINLNDYTVTQLNFLSEILRDNEIHCNEIKFFENSISCDDNIVTMFLYMSNSIIELDLETWKYNVTTLDELEHRIISAAVECHIWYLICENGIQVYDKYSGQVVWKVQYKCEREFLVGCNKENEIIFFPYRGKELLFYNKANRTEKRITIKFAEDYLNMINKNVKVLSIVQQSKGIYFVPRYGEVTFFYDNEEMLCMRSPLALSVTDREKCRLYLNKELRGNNRLLENDELDLEEYFKNV